MADEEDIAQSAVYKFFVGAQRGKFPRLDSREDFWRVLSDLIFKKVQDYLRHQTADKRGDGYVYGEGVLDDEASSAPGLQQFAAHECVGGSETGTPLDELAWEDTLQFLLDRLDPELKAIAHLKLASHANEQIAATLGCSEANIRYKLKQIYNKWRIAWQQSVEPEARRT